MNRSVKQLFDVPGRRRQTVLVEERDGGLWLTSVVASASTSASTGESADRVAARWNATAVLLHHAVDRHGRLVVRLWAPLDGLSDTLRRELMKLVAFEADRREFQLSGRDRY